MSDNNTKQQSKNEEIVDFNIKEFIRFCLDRWYWFAICMACAVGIALFYIYRKEPEYKRYEQLLINDQDASGGAGEIANSFSSLGLFSKNSNVYNELLTITSPAVLYEVADTLQLNMNYFLKDGLRSKTLYGSNLPFKVEMVDLGTQAGASFRLKVLPDGSMEAFKFIRNLPEGKVKYKDKINLKPSTQEFDSPIGKIRISPNLKYVPDDKKNETREIIIIKMPMQTTVELYGLKLSGDLADDDSDVIELSIEDVSVQRAVDILNYVLIVYNQNWLDDKNRISDATTKFIDERLRVIQTDLDNVDKSIAEYMKETGSPDLLETTKINMERGSSLENELISLNNQLSINNYMKEFLDENNNTTTILPVNLGLNSVDLATQIESYNELLLNRDNIISSSSAANPLVENYDRQLRQIRTAIEKTVANRIANLETSIANVKKELASVYAYNASAAETNLPLLNEERQREIKKNLYLFLLQKKEESELTRKFSTDNVKMITPPVGPLKPVSPRKGLIIIIALIIGFGGPLITLYYLETTNTTVRSKKDLENLQLAFVGEIPQIGKKANLKELKKRQRAGKHREESAPLAVVEEGNRDTANEAFRVLRGNIDFMTGKNAGSQVIMVTSINPGSGKSFVAYNLGVSYALKKKKVLLIDCDLRHGSASMYVDTSDNGLTSFLNDSTNDWKELVKKTSNSNLDILPVGVLPPNPAELLEDGRIDSLIEEAGKDYDVIFLDCPPVNVVVDTQILAPLATRTIFVLRSGLLETSALKELNEFYDEKKFNNMSVILNGTDNKKSGYGTYGSY